uniref:D-alanine--poly(Phosphoribitol) ligase subunit 1 n=1 Tax=Lygus hesperus TaxID=30085 RepID=A0A0A9YEC8_LYGHE
MTRLFILKTALLLLTALPHVTGEITLRWSPVPSFGLGPVTDDFGVNSAGNAVVEFRIQLGKLIGAIVRRFSDIPHSSSLDDVPNNKLFDSFVFRYTSGTVGAPDGLNVSSPMLASSSVPPLAGHSSGKLRGNVQ